MHLTPELESCVMHFGEMGSRWGFNRTVGQMFALLVFTEEPLNADQIAAALSVSRGNVSMGIKELQSWQLLRSITLPGDRKDYFKPNGEIWDLAIKVLNERKKREMDPTLSTLRNELLHNSEQQTTYAQQQMQDILELLEMFGGWFSDIQTMKPNQLKTLLKLGAGVGKVLEMKDRIVS